MRKVLYLFLVLFMHQPQQMKAAYDFSWVSDAEVLKDIGQGVVAFGIVTYVGGKSGYEYIRSWLIDTETYEREERERKEKKRAARELAAAYEREKDAKKRLRDEAYAKEQRIERHLQAEQKCIAQHIAKQKRELHEHYVHYQAIVRENSSSSLTPLKYIKSRSEALSAYANGKDACDERHYSLIVGAQSLLSDQGITPSTYYSLRGNIVQRTMHQEFIDIIEDVTRYSWDNKDTKIVPTILAFADAGHVHNRYGRIIEAFSFADFCHGLRKLERQVKEVACDIGAAVGRGIMRGGNNYADKMLHPLQTVEQTVVGLAKIVNTVGNAAGTFVVARMEQGLQDCIDLQNGKITYWGLVARDAKQLYATACDARKTLEHVWKQLDYHTMLLAIEEGSAIATESLLTSATLGALGSLCKAAGNGLDRFVATTDFMRIPLDPNSMQAAICYESTFADLTAARAVSACYLAADVLDDAAKLAPGLVLLSEHGGDGQNNSNNQKNVVNAPNTAWQGRYKFYIDGLDEIDDYIANLTQHNKNHIMVEKHLWDRLVVDPKDFDAIARIMTKVLREGIEDIYEKNPYSKNKNKDGKMKILTIGKEVVQVNFVIKEGIRKVGNGWVHP